jgi:hypothetical protein
MKFKEYLKEKALRSVKVTWSDNSTMETNINGTDKELKNYYKIGKEFNVGQGEKDKILKVKKLDILS